VVSRVVKVRLSGAEEAVTDLTAFLQAHLAVDEVSGLYANRRGSGVRCYLEIDLDGRADTASSKSQGGAGP
jgi:hypothetical protein